MKKILVVVDMQNDFINGALGTQEAIDILPKVIKKIKSYEDEIIYTRDTHGDTYLETQEGNKLPVVHCIEGTRGWELADGIKEICYVGDGIIFDKPTFGSVEMAKYIRELYDKGEIEQIELIGLCTDICIISNALLLKSVIPEMKIVVDSSCCAGVTPESHNNALKAMNMCQIEII